MKNKNLINEDIESIRYMMNYNTRKTLTENREFLNEQNTPITPKPGPWADQVANEIVKSSYSTPGTFNKNLIELLNDTSKSIIKKYLSKVLASFLNMPQKEREQIQIAILEFGVDDFGILRGIKIFGEQSKEEFIKLIMQILENELLIFNSNQSEKLFIRLVNLDENFIKSIIRIED